MLKKIILIAIIALFIFPAAAMAGTYDTDEGTVTFKGLVPCGKEVQINGSTEEIPCQFCHLFVLINEILEFVWFRIAPPIIALMALIAGFLFIFGGGDPSKIKKSRQLFVSLAIGVLLVYGSWLIVNTIFSIMDVKEWAGADGGWSEVNCEIKLDPHSDSSNSNDEECASLAPIDCGVRPDCEWSTEDDCRKRCIYVETKGECLSRNYCYWTEMDECKKW